MSPGETCLYDAAMKTGRLKVRGLILHFSEHAAIVPRYVSPPKNPGKDRPVFFMAFISQSVINRLFLSYFVTGGYGI